MSRRAIKNINWAAIAERLPESEKSNFAVFKAKADQHLRRMTANPESLPKIDWAYYKKHIAAASLVESFQKQYETLSIPYPADKYTAAIDAEEKQANTMIEQFIQDLTKANEDYKQQIGKLEASVPVSEMTMEEFAINYPNDALSSERPTCWPHDFEDELEPGKKVEENTEKH